MTSQRSASPRSCCSVSGSSRRTSRSSGTSERCCCCRCWSSKPRAATSSRGVTRAGSGSGAGAGKRDGRQLDRLAHDHAESGLRTPCQPALRRRRSAGVFRRSWQTMPDRPAFADPNRPQLRWWNIYVGPEVTRAQYEAFDKFGRQLPAAAAGLGAAQLLDRSATRVDGASRATGHRWPHQARAARSAMVDAGALARRRNLDPARRRPGVPGNAATLRARARSVDRPGHRQHRVALRAAISPADVGDRGRRRGVCRRDASAALRTGSGPSRTLSRDGARLLGDNRHSLMARRRAGEPSVETGSPPRHPRHHHDALRRSRTESSRRPGRAGAIHHAGGVGHRNPHPHRPRDLERRRRARLARADPRTHSASCGPATW